MIRKAVFAVLLGTVALAVLWTAFLAAVDAPLSHEQPLYIDIEKGWSFNRVSDSLAQEGILPTALGFKLLAFQQGAVSKLKAGEYEIPPGTTVRQLLAMMVAGKTRQHAVTFVEGWNFRQLLESLESNPAIEKTLEDKSPGEILAAIGAKEPHPEGLFFPDTYFFSKGTSDLEVLERAYGRMQTLLAREWEQRAAGLPLATPYEALILASIIEKETGQPDERDLIAGVFVRRLRIGMLLQTDPTVIYGMGDEFDGNLRSKDLRTPTPYNTYMNTGLPPTPIAMPGIESIRAALNPADGTSLYFVSRGDGTHVFSSSLEDHEHAVDLFQRRSSKP